MSATFPVDVDRNHEKDGNDNYNDSNDNEKRMMMMTIQATNNIKNDLNKFRPQTT